MKTSVLLLKAGFLAIMMVQVAWAQDVLYLKNGASIECRFVGFRGQKLAYQPLDNPGGAEQTVKQRDMSLLFYEDGTYILFGVDGPDGYRTYPGYGLDFDRILFEDGRMEPVAIDQMGQENLTYASFSDLQGPLTTQPLDELMLIVEENGRHHMLGDPTEVARLLQGVDLAAVEAAAQSGVSTGMSTGNSGWEESVPVSSATEAEPTPVEEAYEPERTDRSGGFDSESTEAPATEAPTTETPDPVTEPETEPVDTPETTPSDGAGEGEIDVDLETYSNRALEKTQTLGQYFSLIADKETPWQEANDAIDLAVALFIGEEATVEVSSSNSETKKRFPIRRYLERMKLLKYDQIEIQWSDISYVSKLRKGVDGNYYGVVSFVQRFAGYREG
ncbi:MAG: hypothetical protein AAFV07_14325, partial [Bacteroidota bacterium]